MPFLRFSRDKRGYETTSLMHSFRGRGDARPRLLYWYRTPPDIQVGRAAIDEEAIRALEESHPELTFDWSRILHSHAKPEPADRPPGHRREGRAGRPASPPREVSRRAAAAPAPAVQTHPAEPRETEAAAAKSRRRRRRSKGVEPARLPFPEGTTPAETVPAAEGSVDEREATAREAPPLPVTGSAPAAADSRGGDDAGQAPATLPEAAPHGPALGAIKHEDLARLRARYAEIEARITQRITDPQRLEALRALAEQLNPDGWVTNEEVASGLAEFEAVHSGLKAMLGRRRRRSRRGGVRHRRGGGPARADENTVPAARETSQPGPGNGTVTDDTRGADHATGPLSPADEE